MNTRTTDAAAHHLGDRFAALLRNAATDAEWQTMREANRPGDQSCASHDFCDANMVMLEAFEQTLGREPAFLEGTDDAGRYSPEGDADRLLWNEAWTYAKAAHLTASPVTYDCPICGRWALRWPEAETPACCNVTMSRRPVLAQP